MKHKRPLRPSRLLQSLCPLPTMLDSDEVKGVFKLMQEAVEAMSTGHGETVHLARVYGSAVMSQQLETMGIISPDFPEFSTVIEAACIMAQLKWEKHDFTLDSSELPLINDLMTIELSMLKQCPREMWIEALDIVGSQTMPPINLA